MSSDASPFTSRDGMPRKTVFVVGLGMVGIAFIEKLLNLDEARRYSIVTCGEETHLAYNRVGLTEYFQHRSVENLYLNSPSWYAEQENDRFSFHVGEQVTSVDTAKKKVYTSRNNAFDYDILVLATGSGAGLPPYISLERAEKTRGVFVYRNIADLEAIIAYSERPEVKSASVIGGGLLGLEAAKAVYDMPQIDEVSIVIRQPYPLNRQLDAPAGELVLRKIEDMGVKVHTRTAASDIITSTDSATGSEVYKGLKVGESILPSNLVIFAIGISPRDDLARKSGIKCAEKGGIEVGDDLMTSAEGVYAIGECASWKGKTYGLIAPGVEMADILSFNLTQTDSHAPRKMNDPDLSTKLKLMGVDVASFGDYFADSRMGDTPLAKSLKSASAGVGPTSAATATQGVDKTSDNADKATVKGAEAKERAAKVWETTGIEQATNLVDLGSTVSLKKPNGEDNGAAAGSAGIDQGHGHKKRDNSNEPVKCLTYHDPFSSTYKKYIFTADGQYLLGGMMIGETGDFTKMVSIVKKKKKLEVAPSEFIIGVKKAGDDDGADLDDDTQICSCHNVLKGAIKKCISEGITDLSEIKKKTKAGSGCGGCVPLVTSIYKAEMKKFGQELNNNLCIHFNMSRVDLFQVVKIKKFKDFRAIMETVGVNPESQGCEICKPGIASILSSLYNEHIMKPEHHGLQDTNDRFLANIQRNGTFSVIPRIAGGEVTPEGLIAIGQVAKEYGLYTKITGGQRIDMFGAQKQDLPAIWKKLIDAGFESGHAYGKSLRTVKSCVGTTWCRYGVGDSVGLAIELENRYRGVRSPHKFKGGVSGCVRECAEAQGKDFGLIATDKGWNIFVGGNGGANPRHATLFAADVPPSKVVRIIDRYLMFYIRTADRLARTARWIESFEGGIEKLKKIILDDELGICADLEAEMDALIGTYEDEWAKAVADPDVRKQFRQFANTDETRPQTEIIVERGQHRPADWPKSFPGQKFEANQVSTPPEQWNWVKMATVEDLMPNDENTTSAAVRYGQDSQLAIFHVPRKGYFATQQMCPHKRAFVLDHGIIGDDKNGNIYVSCPLHKRNFRLDTGDCLNDDEYKVLAFEVKEDETGSGDLLVKLPPPDELDALIGSSKWMVRKATAEALGRNAATKIEIVGFDGQLRDGMTHDGGIEVNAGCSGGECGNSKLEW